MTDTRSTCLLSFKGDHWDCYRKFDRLNLIDEWQSEHSADGSNATVVMTKDQLLSVDASKTDFLLGLMAEGHIR